MAAIHEQADRYLHQCFMVGTYEPYIEVCRRLAELSPCGPGEQRSILVNSGAEAIENAVKIARAATGRPAVIVFENAFHGRTLLTMTMTSKLVYKKGFGPFAPEVYRTAGPYPYRGVSSDAALEALEDLFRSDVDPESVACAVLEPVQGEGGFIPMPADFPGRLKELLSSHGILYVDDEVQSGMGRTGPVWAIEHYGVEPDLVVSGKSLGGGLPLAGVTGRAEVMDARAPGRARRHVRREPALVRCGRRRARRGGDARRSARGRTRSARTFARGSTSIAARDPDSRRGARSRADARDRARRRTRRRSEPAADLAKRTTELARERGLVLLACGLYGNVVRILVADPRRRTRTSKRGSRSWRERLSTQATGACLASQLRMPATPSPTSGSSRVRKTFGDVVAVDSIDLEIRARRVLHDARAVRLGQDDDAAPDRRLRAARLRADPPRRRRRGATSRRTTAT